MARLVDSEIEIHTKRTVHRGREAATAWAAKGFDHLYRHYIPESIEPVAGGATVAARLEYVWKDTGRIGDSSPILIELGVRDGLISSWRLPDGPPPPPPRSAR